jgi:serine/threonine-protein kinase
MREAVERGQDTRARKKPLWRRLSRQAARTPAQEQLPSLGSEVGGFRLEAKLGEGGFGTVYRARRGGMLYAVKFLYLPAVEPWAWRELEVMLQLRRVGWMAVEGHGRWPDRNPRFLFLAMPYVRGTPLFDWLREKNPTGRRMAEVVVPLARQIGEVHRAGVVHRDVKGANVLVRKKDGQPVLVDFGVGTYPGAPEVTLPFMLPGTALYRSPEMIRFRRQTRGYDRYQPTPGDDLWALGVLLYCMLTGDYPFQGGDAGDLAEAILHFAPVAPHERNPRVPRALSELCLRMLEKAREARYPDAEAVAVALEAALAEADASWEVPLGEAWGPDNATTPVEVSLDLYAGLARWHRLQEYERQHLRRGVPASGVEATTPLPPTLDAPSTGERTDVEEEPPAPQPPRRTPPRRALAWAVLALLLACMAVLAVWRFRAGTESTPPVATFPVAPAPTTPEVRKLAPAGKSLEGSADAAPSRAPTPAPVASTTLPKEDTRVKTSRKAPAPRQEKQKTKDTGSMVVKAGAVAACTALSACAGPTLPQVRPMPPPAECPPDAVETMKELGIRIGVNKTVMIPGGWMADGRRYMPVREGPGGITMEFDETGTKLPNGTLLSGELFFGQERVYGRFTQAHTPNGPTYPICMVLTGRTAAFGPGVPTEEVMPGDSPGTFKLFFSQGVTPVERFE